ncbi:MAG: hypothetical protein QM817_14265 [Archangium sp.]
MTQAQRHEGLPLLALEFVVFPLTALELTLEGRHARSAAAALAANGMAFVVFSSAALAVHTVEGRLGTLVSITAAPGDVPQGALRVRINSLNRGRVTEISSLSPDVRCTVQSEPETPSDLEPFRAALLERAAKRFPDRIGYLRLLTDAEATLNTVTSWLGFSGDEQYALLGLPLRDRASSVLGAEWGSATGQAMSFRFRLLAAKHWLLNPARWWLWTVFSISLAIGLLIALWNSLD